ncbi:MULTISPECIES: pseudouridine synthase [Megasphaera]|uniref:Pseudouridine synthase n=2 Tax=Megasphaera hutchinsoni TaxID=1588748 RepID=A0A2J8BAM0_9FIRM|nr:MULTISPECIES: pseudouridine synthase [Megasphaera]EGS32758.1 pseudouridine synthase B, ribosomal large subunit [Megasphaera sp. UPII 135-E]MUP48173.1 rRNA pseudouridine synthase [Veillonellaceae bacterium M2-8]MUP58736.1 rRNA pseudouridine synthase [Veillonellaceae bacterium M2-4]PNH21819.1 pseudouridine synthase [Megasphaera genomosp. type_2]
MERLQKVMSNYGVASRRASEKLILEGRVRVNGIIIREVGLKVDPQRDIIIVDGKRIEAQPKRYYLFNKPKGVITTASDEKGRETVMDYFKKVPERIYAVGRLDQNTEGLLLMTNDGTLANILMHPSKMVDKTYEIKVKGRIRDAVLQQLADGVPLADGMTAPADVYYIGYDSHTNITSLEITIHEGRNRQVRRMMEYVGYQVHNLRRVQYAFLTLSGVKRGAYRSLTREEVADLYKYK